MGIVLIIFLAIFFGTLFILFLDRKAKKTSKEIKELTKKLDKKKEQKE